MDSAGDIAPSVKAFIGTTGVGSLPAGGLTHVDKRFARQQQRPHRSGMEMA